MPSVQEYLQVHGVDKLNRDTRKFQVRRDETGNIEIEFTEGGTVGDTLERGRVVLSGTARELLAEKILTLALELIR